MRILGLGSGRSASAHTTALFAFAILFICTALYLRSYSWRDPSSVFFDPQRAFDPIYSSIRQQQADDLIRQAGTAAPSRGPSSDPELFVGVVTVQRGDKQYFPTAVGSLIEGLSSEERARIHLAVFIANTDPNVHSSYHEPWLRALADSIVTYEDLAESEKVRLQSLETNDPKHRVKPLLDYIKLLESGLASGAPWIILLEDDVLAMDGWYHRTKAALDQMIERGEQSKSVYVRLFYNERLHGWNQEEWPRYLFWSVIVAASTVAVLHQLRLRHPPSARFLTVPASLFIVVVCMPMCIGLYFAARKLTVAPIPHGLQRMEKYGCCSQAFAFPREQIPGLIQYYREEGDGYADVLTEKYAEREGLHRWALVPSVFQHVGASSSKGDKSKEISRWGRTGAQNIWNFAFELFDPRRLQQEHRARAGWAG